MRRVVVLVLASGVAFVLALGAGFFDSTVGIAKAKKCPPGSTYEKVEGGTGEPVVCTITQVGTPGNDELFASKDPRITNKIYGRGGNDTLYGYGSRDGLDGGRGRDTLYGGRESDGLYGDSGRDKIYGGPGHDTVFDSDSVPKATIQGEGGGGGQDTISTGPGNDLIYSTDGARDIIQCGPGNSDWVADDGSDVLKDCDREPGVKSYPSAKWWEILMGQ